MDGKRAMKKFFRSSWALPGVLVFWLPDFFAAVFGQTPAARDRLRAGVYPAAIMPASSPAGAPARTKMDSTFARFSTHISAQLAAALQEENWEVLPPETFAAFLQARPAFDPFQPDSVRKLCAAFAAQKLVLPLINIASSDSVATGSLRLILRWLDGASGEVTKFHVSKHRWQRAGPAASSMFVHNFNARALVQALLSAPELILSQEEEIASLPLPQELPAPMVTNKSRKWLWYFSAAAVLGGGSAYWLLGRDSAEGPPKLLPEPPGPPPR